MFTQNSFEKIFINGDLQIRASNIAGHTNVGETISNKRSNASVTRFSCSPLETNLTAVLPQATSTLCLPRKTNKNWWDTFEILSEFYFETENNWITKSNQI